MKDSTSLISINESTALKGLLIFLIVLGHNMIFTYCVLPYNGMAYLYSFHIQAFFILPFLYDSKILNVKRIKDYFFRLYWPFIIISIILYICRIIYNKPVEYNIVELIQMWFTGNPQLIKQLCGIQILWFMPVMCSLCIIKDLYYQSN